MSYWIGSEATVQAAAGAAFADYIVKVPYSIVYDADGNILSQVPNPATVWDIPHLTTTPDVWGITAYDGIEAPDGITTADSVAWDVPEP